MAWSKRIALFAVALLAVVGCAHADRLPLAANQLTTEGGGRFRYALDGDDVRLHIDDPGKNACLAVKPPEGQAYWDLSHAAVLAVDVENLSADAQMRLTMLIGAGSEEQKTFREANVGIGLNPGEKRTMRLLLPHEWQHVAPAGVPAPRTLDTAKVTSIRFSLRWPYETVQPDMVNCRLSNLRLEEPLQVTEKKTDEAYVPFIDAYGQFIHQEWPEKVRSESDLRKAYDKEKAELAASKRPATWDKFGGWANGPQRKTTGYFRTEKVDGKWWFVDPDGHLFFSHGLDVVSAYNDGLKVMPGKENWFAALPEGTKLYQPTEVALRQKYGTEDYRPEYFGTLSKRLEAWGLNSLGDWSRAELMELGTTPYTLQLKDFDSKLPKISASKVKFYDVFDPAYASTMKSLFAESMKKNPIYEKSISDPMCIGYFIDNELNFGNRSGSPAIVDDILKSPAKQAAKQELIKDMKAKYGSIEKLNEAWQTSYESWDAMLDATTVPQGDAYHADAKVFFEKMVDRYFMLARDSIKSVAPHRLYLGARFISTDSVIPELATACARYADVLSVNIYSFSPANFPKGRDFPDVPVLIGEFQFGLRQRGMFHPSLCPAGVTPDDRAHAYTRFVQGALSHPNIVGAHYFQYRDQPLTGRGDSEAYQIGFVDVADTPYQEMCRAARAIGENMYEYRLKGRLTDFGK